MRGDTGLGLEHLIGDCCDLSLLPSQFELCSLRCQMPTKGSLEPTIAIGQLLLNYERHTQNRCLT